MSSICRCPANQIIYDHLTRVIANCDQRPNYKHALMNAKKSVKLYVLPIQSKEEACTLNGIGPQIAKECMKAFKQNSVHNCESNSNNYGNSDNTGVSNSYLTSSNDANSNIYANSCSNSCSNSDMDDYITNIKTSQTITKRSRKYLPGVGKAPWIVLLCLHNRTLSKEELEKDFNRFVLANSEICNCIKDFRDCWANVRKTLLSKGIIIVPKEGYFSLTEIGNETALSMHQHYLSIKTYSNSITTENSHINSSSSNLTKVSNSSLPNSQELYNKTSAIDSDAQSNINSVAFELLPLSQRLQLSRSQECTGDISSVGGLPSIISNKVDLIDLVDDSDDEVIVTNNTSSTISSQVSNNSTITYVQSFNTFTTQSAIRSEVSTTLKSNRSELLHHNNDKNCDISIQRYASSLLASDTEENSNRKKAKLVHNKDKQVNDRVKDSLPLSVKETNTLLVEENLVDITTMNCTWDIILLVDKREKGNSFIQSQMIANNIRCELDTLAVGDFLWIARPINSDTQSNGIPIVLDCVAERKSIADLASSILDGRYFEQKYRLEASGVRSCIYLVEGENLALPLQQKAITSAHLKTAMIAANVDSSMHVIRTRSKDHTISVLQSLHRQVTRRFISGNSGTRHQSYQAFQATWGKRSASTYGQLFGYALRQIPGCSKAVAVTLMIKYGTINNFMESLSSMNKKEAEKMLANLEKDGDGLRPRFGPKLAAKLWQIFMEEY